MYPADFNGIIAGGVARFWTHAATEQLVLTTNLKNAGITGPAGAATVNLSQSAATATCDALDGVVDGLISDPRRCHWDPYTLICKPGQASGTCITPPQAAAIQADIYPLRDRSLAGIFSLASHPAQSSTRSASAMRTAWRRLASPTT